MSMYRKSEATSAITVARPIDTVTTLEVKGSDDAFTADRTEFSSEEEIRINGTVTAADNADLSMSNVEVYSNGSFLGNAALVYDGVTNNYIYSLGLLTEGARTIRVVFPRLRLYAVSLAERTLGIGLPHISLPHIALALLALVTGAGVGYYIAKRRSRI